MNNDHKTPASPVSYERRGDIAIIRTDNPPVNALSHAVRSGLAAAIECFEADAAARAAVLHCEGRTFFAGADIREFGQPPREPLLPDLVNRIEACAKPVVAALHGTALGGGLEVALGAHYRVAIPGARVGLPEVHLGILPGAGGTQRLPRLVGAEKALEMITTGHHVSAPEAAEAGLIDAIMETEPLDAGLALARKLIDESAGVRRTAEITPPPADPALFDDWRARVSKKARGQLSPVRCVDAVRAAFDLPFAEGLQRERDLFTELLNSPQREALIHAFFAERQVSKLPELSGITARPVESVGVIGGGTMGTGIATACLLHGLPVTLIERDAEAAGRARETIAGYLDGAVKRRKLDAPGREAILAGALTTGTDYEALAGADLVIEAVFEDMAVKKDVFARLDAICKAGAVLATNTSYLDVNEIAAATSRPADVLGLHFFSPAHVMKLLEVVVADRTAPEVLATGFALGRRLGKIAVRAGVCDGFIGNRILAKYREAADHMVLDGASPYQIDRALTGFGFAMGPYAVADLAGLDIGWATRKRKAATRDARARAARFPDVLCEKGRFGRKTGRGYYIYDADSPAGRPDPEVEEIIAAERAERGIAARDFGEDEIIRRYMGAMINEAASVVAEGIARRPLDVDVVLLAGYGFPRWRGGPMKYADMQGLDRVLEDLETFAAQDAYFWQPAPLLRDLVARGRDFDSLNRAQ